MTEQEQRARETLEERAMKFGKSKSYGLAPLRGPRRSGQNMSGAPKPLSHMATQAAQLMADFLRAEMEDRVKEMRIRGWDEIADWLTAKYQL